MIADHRMFVHQHLYKTEGFLHPIDAMVLLGLSLFQRSRGIRGGIVEIGVFYGRSFSLLARTLQPGREKALAIDLFDIGVRQGLDSKQLESFKRTMSDAGVLDADYSAWAANSRNLAADTILEAVGRVRLFSIDGGHEKPDVDHDCALAMASLHPEGAIAFDDFFNAQYPDVTCSILDFINASSGKMRPFCLTRNKLYVCRDSAYPGYMECLSGLTLWAGASKQTFKFLGWDVFHCTQSMTNRVLYQKAAEFGLGGLADKLLRASKPKHTR